jgi:hypothetical protein
VLDLRTSQKNDMSLDSMEPGRLEERGEEWVACSATASSRRLSLTQN